MRKIAEHTPSELLVDILLLLFEAGRGSSQLATAMAELRGREVALATFYRHLQKGIDLGWVDSMDESVAGSRSGPGRPERVYRITGVGTKVLRAGMAQQRRRIARAEALGLLTGGTP